MDISQFSEYSSEQEVLIFPYFKFEVMRNYPYKVGSDEVIRVVEVREIEDFSIYRGVRFLWYDDNMHGKVNPDYSNENEYYVSFF